MEQQTANTMEQQIATVDSNGHLVLPRAVIAALGIHPGTQLEVSVVDQYLYLEPIAEDPIEAVRGMFGPGSRLEDDLIELRALER